MIITIHQPEHLPWLGFFNKMSKADKYIFLDNVQFRKQYVQNRNRIMGNNGPQWLTVPVTSKNYKESTIKDIRISKHCNSEWKRNYFLTLYYNYKKHPYFNDHIQFFEALLSMEWELLVDLNYAIIHYFAKTLGFNMEFLRASELNPHGKRSDLVLNICKLANADTYISGPTGRDYLKVDDFCKCGIEVVFNDFEHPFYKQYNRDDFTPYLSVIDLLFNYSPEEARDIITRRV